MILEINLDKNGDKLIKKGLYYVDEMKSLGSAEIQNIKEKLIIFKNELIRKIRLKKILTITMVLKILDIYLMKRIFTMLLMILNICSMELHSIELMKMKTKILKEMLIMLKNQEKQNNIQRISI